MKFLYILEIFKIKKKPQSQPQSTFSTHTNFSGSELPRFSKSSEKPTKST